eukprot:COSAG05_NODE_795_length_7281_cov_33.551100_6_plen_104_part_00
MMMMPASAAAHNKELRRHASMASVPAPTKANHPASPDDKLVATSCGGGTLLSQQLSSAAEACAGQSPQSIQRVQIQHGSIMRAVGKNKLKCTYVGISWIFSSA